MKKEEKGLSIPLRISIIIISKCDLAAKQRIVHKEVLPMERMDVYITAYRLINKYNAKTKQPKTFGTAETVCGSEAQVLDVVAHTQLVTCSQIASALGITKGAVSQTLAKLEKKALIERAPARDGCGTVAIRLTEKGQEILTNYYAWRECRLRKVIAAARALPPESAKAMLQMLEAFEAEALDQYQPAAKAALIINRQKWRSYHVKARTYFLRRA